MKELRLTHLPPVAHAAQLLAFAAMAATALPTTAHAQAGNAAVAQAAQHDFDVPAGKLGSSLSALAGQAGVSFSADTHLLEGKQAPALRGRYSLQEGFARLLAGSGLEASAQGGGYVLRSQAQSSIAAAPASVSSVPATAGAHATQQLPEVAVKVDWLASPSQSVVFDHGGSRTLLERADFQAQGASTVREALARLPGVSAPENNGTGSHDLAFNIGIRGLNPRLGARSTILMDGIPVPFAPYGQPQLSIAPISLGNMDAIDVVRGGGAVRYGPQNVGGIINFVTRAIPEKFAANASVQSEWGSGRDPKTTASALVGGTSDSGVGGAILYSGVRGSDWRDHSSTRIDDVILKGRARLDSAQTISAMLQQYEGRADMPGGLSVQDYKQDRFQSTRPYDSFWGRRTLASASYDYKPDSQRQFNVTAFHTSTLRSGYLDQGKNLTLSPRQYWVRGVETRYSQGFTWGSTHHEIGVGHRFISEASHELRYWAPKVDGVLPTSASPYDRDTRGKTEAHAVYIDDKIMVGNWVITPGLRYEKIKARQTNLRTDKTDALSYNQPLPALNVIYNIGENWAIYANTDSSFGSIQYSKMSNAVTSGSSEPEKARSWELGARYSSAALQADFDFFTLRFNNQYESNQQDNSVYARGKTRHSGFEGSLRYELGSWQPALKGFALQASYAYVQAEIAEDGINKGNQVPFSPRHKGTVGVSYAAGPWQAGADVFFQSSQFADNENTVAENADGNNGRIPGYATLGLRTGYTFRPSSSSKMTLAFGIKNVLDREYYTRSFDDNNKGKYTGQPRTYYVQLTGGF